MSIVLLFVDTISLTEMVESYYNIAGKNKEMQFRLWFIHFISLICILWLVQLLLRGTAWGLVDGSSCCRTSQKIIAILLYTYCYREESR